MRTPFAITSSLLPCAASVAASAFRSALVPMVCREEGELTSTKWSGQENGRGYLQAGLDRRPGANHPVRYSGAGP
jgi:hypothetical protein